MRCNQKASMLVSSVYGCPGNDTIGLASPNSAFNIRLAPLWIGTILLISGCSLHKEFPLKNDIAVASLPPNLTITSGQDQRFGREGDYQGKLLLKHLPADGQPVASIDEFPLRKLASELPVIDANGGSTGASNQINAHAKTSACELPLPASISADSNKPPRPPLHRIFFNLGILFFIFGSFLLLIFLPLAIIYLFSGPEWLAVAAGVGFFAFLLGLLLLILALILYLFRSSKYRHRRKHRRLNSSLQLSPNSIT